MTPAQAHALREDGRGHDQSQGLEGRFLHEDVPAGHVLDNPVWAALRGPHARFAVTAAAGAAPRAVRYPSDVTPFAAVADPADPRSWADLAALAGPGAVTGISGALTVPEGWDTVASIPGVQLVDTSLRAEAEPEAVRLGPADVPEILGLIALAQPGPFLPRTVELGRYLGIRRQGRLVAMAGERLRPPGWTEISAVCTHPEHGAGDWPPCSCAPSPPASGTAATSPSCTPPSPTPPPSGSTSRSGSPCAAGPRSFRCAYRGECRRPLARASGPVRRDAQRIAPQQCRQIPFTIEALSTEADRRSVLRESRVPRDHRGILRNSGQHPHI